MWRFCLGLESYQFIEIRDEEESESRETWKVDISNQPTSEVTEKILTPPYINRLPFIVLRRS